jgi:hypothetical protein
MRFVSDGGSAPVNGAGRWRADASPQQMLRAAVGLESIADTCEGARRDELLELARDLRERARGRREVEGRRRTRFSAP